MPSRFPVFRSCIVALALLAAALSSTSRAARAAAPAWVEKSDRNTQLLLDQLARVSPEGAGQLGVPGLDEQIRDLKPGFETRAQEASRKVRAELQRRLGAETDPRV